ncbi:MAG: hypothetical protein PHQ40_11935 [Anaerolineaceae bacterium]|nr:hypothetical protein [Anaerolineaceae bacterium]
MTRLSIACFISAHGYGHAARACAVLEALQQHIPDLHVEIFTQTPAWFFEESLPGPFGYHPTDTDVGMAQSSPLQEDLPATLARLAAFLPFHPGRVEALARHLVEMSCRLVLCDIAALGLAAARKAGIPAVLQENFTWDWIYRAYLSDSPTLSGPIDYLRIQYLQADIHIQTEPVCVHSPRADFIAGPVSRLPRTPREETRSRLGLPSGNQAVLVTMGGITAGEKDWSILPEKEGLTWIIPSGSEQLERMDRRGNRLLLPNHSHFYHPDLVYACDAIVGKAGYSTVAEVYQAGKPFAFLSRPRFPESQVLANFILEKMSGFELRETELHDPGWVERLLGLTHAPQPAPMEMNGADSVAVFIASLI